MELDSDAMQWQRYRATSRCESVTGARTAHPSGCAGRGYGERNPHQVSSVMQKAAKRVFVLQGETCPSRAESPSIIKADLRERMLPHGKELMIEKHRGGSNVEIIDSICYTIIV